MELLGAYIRGKKKPVGSCGRGQWQEGISIVLEAIRLIAFTASERCQTEPYARLPHALPISLTRFQLDLPDPAPSVIHPANPGKERTKVRSRNWNNRMSFRSGLTAIDEVATRLARLLQRPYQGSLGNIRNGLRRPFGSVSSPTAEVAADVNI